MLTTLADLQSGRTDIPNLILRARRISSRYDDHIAAESRKPQNRLPGIHASEVYGCKRKTVYSLLSYKREENISKNWRQRFAVGHALHDMLQSDFERMAKDSEGLLDFQREVVIAPHLQPIAEKWFINSSCDGVFTEYDVAGGPPILRYGLEIKTEAPDGFASLKAPKEAHLWQAHIYMKCLDLPMFWFLYMNKGNQNNTDSSGSFFVTWDQKIWDDIEKCFTECHEAAANFTFPPREESMICQFCAFSYTCMPPSLTRTSMPQPGRPWMGR